MTIPSDQLVAKYIEYRNFLAKKQEEFDAANKPYVDAMETIANEMLARLNADNLQNIKTEFGTAFKQTTLSVKMADRTAFFNYVFSDPQTARQLAESFFTTNIAKEPVKEFLERHQTQPPGVSVDHVTKVLFRKA